METVTVVAPERQRNADAKLMMRLPLQTKELIETAAQIVSKTVSAFVIESARKRAIEVLLDQTVFHLSAQQAEAFAQVLDNPPAPTEKLKALMRSKAPWEK
jgi:uncharacterized protein (DUF1778 family)